MSPRAAKRSAALDVARIRVSSQRLDGARLGHPAEVVRWFGAVQAQDYLASLWAVGLRLRGATEAIVEAAVGDGSIVRTWPMRGTLHFVPAEDARWMLGLLTPRVVSATSGRHRELGLDAGVFAQAERLTVAALSGGRRLTRPAFNELLQAGGISTEGSRGLHILGYLAQRQVICLAGREGKQHMVALLDEWVKRHRALQREEALGELSARYFRGHGPATVHDFAWWSGLKLSDARTALELAAPSLASAVVEDRTVWFSADAQAAPAAAAPAASLLPFFDEYTVAYRERGDVVAPAHARRIGSGGILNPTIVIDGRVVGTWRRELKKQRVVVTLAPFGPLKRREKDAVAAEAERYGEFLGRAASLA